MRDHINDKLAEARARAAELGVEFCVNDKAFIDDEHLDCVWYGGYIGCIKYKGYQVNAYVSGEVRIFGRENGKYPNFDYCDKHSDGAWGYSNDMTDNFKNDTEYYVALDNDIDFENNNWIELVLFENGTELDYWDIDDNNVLDAMCDIDGIFSDIEEELKRVA